MGIRARGLGGLARVLSDRALTQRHTGDRHHFEADLRSNPGRTCWSWRAICGMCGRSGAGQPSERTTPESSVILIWSLSSKM